MRVLLVPIVQLDVIVAAIGLFLHLKGNEAQLDAVALLGGQQPLTVGVTWVVVVSKLGVRVEVLLTNFCLQTTSTLFRDEKRKSEVFKDSKKSKILPLQRFVVVRLPVTTTRGRYCL